MLWNSQHEDAEKAGATDQFFTFFLKFGCVPEQASGILHLQPLTLQAYSCEKSAGFGIAVVLSTQYQPGVLLDFTTHYIYLKLLFEMTCRCLAAHTMF